MAGSDSTAGQQGSSPASPHSMKHLPVKVAERQHPLPYLWQQTCLRQAGRQDPPSLLQLAGTPPVAAKLISSAPAYSPIQGAEKVSGYPKVMPGGTSKVRGPLKASPRQSAVTERGAAPGFTMGICRHQTGSPGVRWSSAKQIRTPNDSYCRRKQQACHHSRRDTPPTAWLVLCHRWAAAGT